MRERAGACESAWERVVRELTAAYRSAREHLGSVRGRERECASACESVPEREHAGMQGSVQNVWERAGASRSKRERARAYRSMRERAASYVSMLPVEA